MMKQLKLQGTFTITATIEDEETSEQSELSELSSHSSTSLSSASHNTRPNSNVMVRPYTWKAQ